MTDGMPLEDVEDDDFASFGDEDYEAEVAYWPPSKEGDQ